MTFQKPETGNDPDPPSRPNRVGWFAVAKLIFSGMVMIGKKETWEADGVGAQMTPRQIVVGAVAGGLVLAVVLFLLVRIAIGFAAS